MQKIKFDFEATKERIYAPNSNVPIGAPVDRNGNIANDGNAYGIVLCKETENEKYWVRYNLVVMVAGYCDIIDAQAIWGDEYSAEAMAAMSDITFCDNHELPTGGGGGGAMVVTINQIIDPESGTEEFTADKTGEEIYNAMSAGCVVGVLHLKMGDTEMNANIGCGNLLIDNGAFLVAFSYPTVGEQGNVTMTRYVVYPNTNTWSVYTI